MEQDLPRGSIVQNVSFDPNPGQDDQGRCHGFAFIVVRDLDIVEKLTNDWPWDLEVSKPTALMDGVSQSGDLADARRYGFRALKQKRWLVLKQEYLEYRQCLVDIPSPSKPSGSTAAAIDPEHAIESRRSDQRAPAVLLEAHPHSQPHADVFQDLPSYPHGCLAFIKNVHPETNKTTLKELLSAAFRQDGEAGTGQEVDYVDYLKGIDSCHVRLSQPALTTQLRDYFATHRVYQATGLDGAGVTISDADSGSKSIQVEIIQGRKEELYWAKVPDKVRATALLKIYQMAGEEKGVNPGHDKKRRRKR
ncbi:hypothetical protein BS47DRAFT_607885 [Hydnum rufescens UP504]|uniref:XRRM domain-containing protein n=1 Tax=Hydnum rufescens UP504 TaxID=1448309 RepID=A0A9P6B358_9AGAM|nr:hypothetical protein BS47DRAFT_607885 [Hydnum rufescens UP504]